jgi:hypothetical protein
MTKGQVYNVGSRDMQIQPTFVASLFQLAQMFS